MLNTWRFLQYISALKNSPGETIFDFMVRMFTGNEDCRRVGLLRAATVRGQEFQMPSTYIIIVNKDSSSKHSPYVLKIDTRMAHAEQIFCSQALPICLFK